MLQVLFIRVQLRINHFLTDILFFIRRIVFIDSSYNYWISKTVNGEIINKRFLRQELFALKEQFI